MAMIYDLQNAENGAEGGDQCKSSWRDFDFVSQDRYQESEYGRELIDRFASLSILMIKSNGISEFNDIGIWIYGRTKFEKRLL
jgi:hypothetical protein